jgi:uncharacterized membrane protein YheB (UPF0754 family)
VWAAKIVEFGLHTKKLSPSIRAHLLLNVLCASMEIRNIIWLLPLSGACFGFLCVLLLSRLIFFPVAPVKILGLRFQGWLPSKRAVLVTQLAKLIQSRFLNAEVVGSQLSDPTHFQAFQPMIEQHVDHFLRVKLKESMPMVGMLIGDRTINQMKSVFLTELETLFPQIIAQFGERVAGSFPIERLIDNESASWASPNGARELFKRVNPELRKFYLVGAVAGFFIGLLQLLLMFLLR